jgi:acetate kinase
MSDAILVVNSGSTSVKFAAYAMGAAGSLPVLCGGRIDSMQGDPHFVVKNEAGKPLAAHEWGEGHAIDHKTALHFVITWLAANFADMKVVAAGHRVVLGGARFEAPTRIEGDVLDYLESLAVMEPSHQTFNVRGARALAEAFPGLPQIACFDSSFHRTMPEMAQTYALPQDVRDAGVRHWGYHGISYDYISRQVPKFAPQARRVIAAHLGDQHVRHVGRAQRRDHDGLRRRVRPAHGDALGRRAGGRTVLSAAAQIVRRRVAGEDAVRTRGIARPVRHQRRHASVAGEHGAARRRGDGVFRFAMTKYAGAYAGVLGGLDAFVFTAGIGEHSAPVRAALCSELAWLGVKLDAQANASGGPRISTPDSGVSVWVIPTNEELMIAQCTLALVRK